MTRNPSRRAALARGFTLVEIMVVVAIVGLLATMVTVNVMDSAAEARVETARADLAQIHQTASLFAVRHARVPEMQELIEPDANGRIWLEGYDSPPRDPWEVEYELRALEGARSGAVRFEIVSAGPDRELDTEDDLSSAKKQ